MWRNLGVFEIDINWKLIDIPTTNYIKIKHLTNPRNKRYANNGVIAISDTKEILIYKSQLLFYRPVKDVFELPATPFWEKRAIAVRSLKTTKENWLIKIEYWKVKKLPDNVDILPITQIKFL